MKRIIIDMDEVIADPMGDMIAWYKQAYGRDVDLAKMDGSWIRGFPEEDVSRESRCCIRRRII